MNPDQVSDHQVGPGWWLASDGRWYAPELAPAAPQDSARWHTDSIAEAEGRIGGTPVSARTPGVPYIAGDGSIVDPGV